MKIVREKKKKKKKKVQVKKNKWGVCQIKNKVKIKIIRKYGMWNGSKLKTQKASC